MSEREMIAETVNGMIDDLATGMDQETRDEYQLICGSLFNLMGYFAIKGFTETRENNEETPLDELIEMIGEETIMKYFEMYANMGYDILN